jgi:hypothetical protein
MAYATYFLYIVLWVGFTLGGCAYVVFWRDASGWWFVLAVMLASSGYSPRRWIDRTPREDR